MPGVMASYCGDRQLHTPCGVSLMQDYTIVCALKSRLTGFRLIKHMFDLMLYLGLVSCTECPTWSQKYNLNLWWPKGMRQMREPSQKTREMACFACFAVRLSHRPQQRS